MQSNLCGRPILDLNEPFGGQTLQQYQQVALKVFRRHRVLFQKDNSDLCNCLWRLDEIPDSCANRIQATIHSGIKILGSRPLRIGSALAILIKENTTRTLNTNRGHICNQLEIDQPRNEQAIGRLVLCAVISTR